MKQKFTNLYGNTVVSQALRYKKTEEKKSVTNAKPALLYAIQLTKCAIDISHLRNKKETSKQICQNSCQSGKCFGKNLFADRNFGKKTSAGKNLGEKLSH